METARKQYYLGTSSSQSSENDEDNLIASLLHPDSQHNTMRITPSTDESSAHAEDLTDFERAVLNKYIRDMNLSMIPSVDNTTTQQNTKESTHVQGDVLRDSSIDTAKQLDENGNSYNSVEVGAADDRCNNYKLEQCCSCHTRKVTTTITTTTTTTTVRMTEDGFEEGGGCIASIGELAETGTAGHLSRATMTIMAHNGLSPSVSISCPSMPPTGHHETVSPSQQTTVKRSPCDIEDDSFQPISVNNDVEQFVTILTPPVTPLASKDVEQLTHHAISAHVQSDNTPNAHPDSINDRRFSEVHKQSTPKINPCEDVRSAEEIATDIRNYDGIVVGVLVADKVDFLNTSRSPSQASMVSLSSSSSSSIAAAAVLSSPNSPSLASDANSSPPLSESATVAMLTFAHNRRKGSYRKRKKRRDRHRK
ncbi:uncharacterized protein LOC125958213 [Anopheles darlingi]|uniref:uncharacterized protein LOC125958213 n=1 Tax=Anopheles darlingi TaxID=43151 RepID=UPI00210000A0|nr:uncharacterized protein LOC125958213 [Anopheles darlingi]